MIEPDDLAVALELVLGDEAGTAPEQSHTLIALDRVLVERDPVVDDPSDAHHHSREVDLHLAGTDAEITGVSRVVRYLTGSDQSLGRDAPARDSGAADRSALEERHPLASLACGPDGGPATHAGADHGDVEPSVRARGSPEAGDRSKCTT